MATTKRGSKPKIQNTKSPRRNSLEQRAENLEFYSSLIRKNETEVCAEIVRQMGRSYQGDITMEQVAERLEARWKDKP